MAGAWPAVEALIKREVVIGPPKNAGVIELPDSNGWLDTGTGSGYSGTAWKRHDPEQQP